jgi:DNA helicase-2/ATP-dependent DNA helicase PcrA
LLAGLREQWGQADPATVLEKVIVATGYERYLADEGAEGVDRLENVQELIAGAAEWAEEAVTGNGAGEEESTTLLERYLTQVALVTPADGGADAPAGVALMTVHMAKGLEWSLVALTGLEDGLFRWPLGGRPGWGGGGAPG